MKRKWIIAVLALGVLASGMMGGTLLAQGSGTDDDSGSKSFAARVAAILERDEEEVKAAFKQAKEDIRDEKVQQRLDHLVEQEVIDRNKANEYLEWYRNQPEGVPPLFPGHGKFRGRGKFHGQGPRPQIQGRLGLPNDLQLPGLFGGLFSSEGRDEAVQRKLDRMVEEEVIDQSQAQAYLDFFNGRPNGVPRIFTEGMSLDEVQGELDKLAKQEVIDEAQAQAYLEWYGGRPGDVPNLFTGQSIFEGLFSDDGLKWRIRKHLAPFKGFKGFEHGGASFSIEGIWEFLTPPDSSETPDSGAPNVDANGDGAVM